jgi:hypothetical protein
MHFYIYGAPSRSSWGNLRPSGEPALRQFALHFRIAG